MDPELKAGLADWASPITGVYQKNGIIVYDYAGGAFGVRDGDDTQTFLTAEEVLLYLEKTGLL